MNQILGLLIMAVAGMVCAYIAYKQGMREGKAPVELELKKVKERLEMSEITCVSHFKRIIEMQDEAKEYKEASEAKICELGKQCSAQAGKLCRLRASLEEANKQKDRADLLSKKIAEQEAELKELRPLKRYRCAKCRRFIPTGSDEKICPKCKKELEADLGLADLTNAEVGDTIVCRNGETERIIAIDHRHTWNGYPCPVIAGGSSWALNGEFNPEHASKSDDDAVKLIKKGKQ